MEKETKNRNWLYVVLSVALAVCLWVYVSYINSSDNTYTFRNVPVEFTGLDTLEGRGLMISDGAEQTITLNVRTSWSTALRLSSEAISVTVDVSSIESAGTYTTGYRINYPTGVSGNSVSITGSTAQNVTYTVARRTERSVEVQGVFRGEVAEGYQREEFSFSPSTILIAGEESAVNQVDHALVTVTRDEPLSETFSGEMPFQLIGLDGTVLDLEELNLETDVNTVQVTLPVVQLKEVELTVDLLPGGGATADNAVVTINPSTITVSGSETDLAGLSSISLGEIELGNIFSQDTFTFDIQLASGLENVSGETQATVTVEITGLTTRTLEVDNIQWINAPEGCTVELVSQVRQIQIRGSEEAVNAVIASQISIVADLTDATIGTQNVPARVSLNGASDVGVVGDENYYRVVVNIARE
ncbi:MAG TPA: hypothetical protein H9714_10775 [Candidatus Flavonifractor intestinipullorum]|uniref:YbbR-like protein n=1 Tax=Candidatus Flavonifractor intestinipullorum TaxID=2838587 RepID=A0A9D2S6M9_9FIRM|nr:hypothetical protein [Candidatus Flavonifractor intestinipullorum]